MPFSKLFFYKSQLLMATRRFGTAAACRCRASSRVGLVNVRVCVCILDGTKVEG
jgi:hypothetical protein